MNRDRLVGLLLMVFSAVVVLTAGVVAVGYVIHVGWPP